MVTTKVICKPNKNGLSILEALLALVIMSVSLSAIFTTIGTASSAIYHNNLKTQALLLAETKLSECKLGPLNSFDSFSGKSGRFIWKIEIIPTECEMLGIIKSEVSWVEKNNKNMACLKTFVQMQNFKD